MIPGEKIEEIRNRADIVAVVSEYVKLRKTGKNYVGLCPFHAEKTPSFTVSPEKQLFHCFGCGEGGNLFSFIMKVENIGFAEAAAELGARLGIAVEKTSSTGVSKSESEKLFETVLLAAKFFRKCFEEETGKCAREYLKQRGIAEQTAKTFGLGFAPEGWDNLFKHLISRGAAPHLIERAGLTLPRETKDGYYDRFRNRLIFPVTDVRGRIIAFSGRALNNEEPKYLNSPETAIYRKGETIFGLNLSRESIKKEKTALLVEGNLDLITVFQAGITNVASPLGTALTVFQCKLLARFAENTVLAFDADSAGDAAAERSVELLRAQGLKVKVAVIKGAKDPDELVQKEGAEAFKNIIDSALPFLEFKIKKILGRHNLAEIESRAKGLREVAAVLAPEKDPFVQKEYAKMAAKLLKIDPEAILAEIKVNRTGMGKNLRRVTEKPASKIAEAENNLITLSTQNLDFLKEVKRELQLDDFNRPEARSVMELLFSVNFGETGDPAHFLLDHLPDEAAKKFLSGVLLSNFFDHPQAVLTDCIQVLKKERARSRMEALKSELREAESKGESQKAAELLAALKNEIS